MRITQLARRIVKIAREELRFYLKGRVKFPPTHANFVVVPLSTTAEFYPESSPSIAVFLHAFYVDQIGFIQTYMASAPRTIDVYVSTDTQFKASIIENNLRPLYGDRLTIRVFENRGRDIAPKFVGFRNEHCKYDYVCHIHTKKSEHDSVLAEWSPWIMKCLLGTPSIVSSIICLFDRNPKLGIVAPRIFWYVRKHMTWKGNFDTCARLSQRWGVTLDFDVCPDFPSGSMFWARPAALAPLFHLDLRYEDFENEQGQIDGTLAHAVERLVFFACEKAGYSWIRVGPRERIARFERPQADHLSQAVNCDPSAPKASRDRAPSP